MDSRAKTKGTEVSLVVLRAKTKSGGKCTINSRPKAARFVNNTWVQD